MITRRTFLTAASALSAGREFGSGRVQHRDGRAGNRVAHRDRRHAG